LKKSVKLCALQYMKKERKQEKGGKSLLGTPFEVMHGVRLRVSVRASWQEIKGIDTAAAGGRGGI
jgi:hypothetical protein